MKRLLFFAIPIIAAIVAIWWGVDRIIYNADNLLVVGLFVVLPLVLIGLLIREYFVTR